MYRLALRYAKIELISPASQTTKPLASGAATRWQGYVAREGFGITRIRNQISDNIPAMGNTHINQQYFLLCLRYLPVFGQTDTIRFFLRNDILHTSTTCIGNYLFTTDFVKFLRFRFTI